MLNTRLDYNRVRRSVWQVTLSAVAAVALGALGCASHLDPEVDELGLVTEAVVTASPADRVFGFERAQDWRAQSGTLAGSTDSTRGTKALKASGFSGYVPIVSAQVASTAPELEGIGVGTVFAIDAKLPVAQQNPWWHGAMQMYISVPSRNLHNVYLGQHELTSQPKGVYQTYSFELPDSAGTALAGRHFSDMTITVVLNVPQGNSGSYLLDNLRLREPFPTGDESTAQAGEHILVRAWKSHNQEADRIEDVNLVDAIVQVPQSFHVVEGNPGDGTLKLEYGRNSLSSCTYRGDGSANYQFQSCQDGSRPGELRATNRVRVSVVSSAAEGDRTKVRAQLALNPLGDALGNIAPIPTYFGASAAEAEQILKAYIDAQQSWPLTSAKLIRVPTPDWEFQRKVVNNDDELLPVIPADSNDPPFRQDGRLTNSDLLDAEWAVYGALDLVVQGRSRTTSANATLEVNGYLLGLSTNLATLSGKASTTIEQPEEGLPTSAGTAEFCYAYLPSFDVADVWNDCVGVSASGDIDTSAFTFETAHEVFEERWWIFAITGDVVLTAGLNASVGFSDIGGNLTFTPFGNAKFVVDGGVDLSVFGGGGISGEIDLIDVRVPTTLAVNAPVDLGPRVCQIQPNMSMTMSVDVSSGAGVVKWYVQGGASCGYWDGLCWRDEGEFYDWPGFVEESYPVITSQPIVNLPPINWPYPEDCSGDLTVSVVTPEDGLELYVGQLMHLNLAAFRQFGNGEPEDVSCQDMQLSITDENGIPYSDTVTPVGDCMYEVQLSAIPGERRVSITISDEYGSGSATTTYVGQPFADDSPPIPFIRSIEPGYSLPCGQVATLVADFTYPNGDPNNVRIDWFRWENSAWQDIGQGEFTKVLNVGLYQMNAYDVVNDRWAPIQFRIARGCAG